jgi:putative ABC transport system permease protein
MESLFRDIRYGARSLRKSPALTLISIFALTLGIGLTTTMYSIVYGALMRGLPFDRSERIMHVGRSNPSRNELRMDFTAHDYVDYRDAQKSFDQLAAYYTGTVNISGTEKAERFDGAFTTHDLFALLRVRPLIGRGLQPADDQPGAPYVAVIGYQMWKERFAGDPNVIGRVVRANGEPATIVGVMPEKFAFPENEGIWVPLRLDVLKLERGAGQSLDVVGRLRDGVSLDQAALDLNAIAKRLAAEYPKTNEGVGATIQPFVDRAIGEEAQSMLYTMLGAVGFVLLIACANVANLLLGRAAHRSKEVGVRTALGASRAAVVRQFLAEALILAGAGAAIGVGMAYAGVKLFNDSIAGTEPPFWLVIKVDAPILLFAIGLALLATLFSGLFPALQASRADVSEVLKDEARGSSSFRIGRLSRGLVMFEIALSCGLLVAAGLMIKSVTKLRTIDMGFSPDVFTARVGLPDAKYRSDTAQLQFYDQLEPRLAAIAGVEAAGLVSRLPATGSWYAPFAREGVAYAKEQDYPRARRVSASPGFFAVFDAKLLQGRLLTSEDRRGALPVAVVNQSFVRKHFGGESPLGRRVRWNDGGADTTARWLTIVGVVGDMYAGEVNNRDPEAIYTAFAQQPERFVSIAAKTRGAPGSITPMVRDAVASIDADLPIYFVRTLRESIARSTWFHRVFGTLFMIFGFVALVLAAVGLYAVMSFSVSRRLREVGVRMALGAQSGDVLWLVFRQGFVQIASGMSAGLALAFGASQLLKMLLFEVSPTDPTVFGGTVAVLVAAGFLACIIPARRATRVDPMVALRTD